MKGYKRLFFLTALLICLLACARAETARVLTPGGGLNMRKKADAKSALVDSVPNRALVEVLEIDDAWTKVTYQKKTGYVKTEFLKLPANLPGKTVYADAGTLLIRQEPAKDAPILLPVGAMEGVLVESVAGEWALVRCGQMAGYVEIAAISYQYEEPVGDMTWVRQEGVTAAACQMRAAPKADAPTAAALEAGADVTVTEIGKEYCLVVAQEGCGYVLPGEICLKGAPDGEARTGSLSPMEAAERAEAALKKKYRAFGKGKFYFTADVPAEGQYGCCFQNPICYIKHDCRLSEYSY